MRVKITVQFNDENGDYRHADLSKPLFVDVRDHIAELWVKNGWAIAIPLPEGEKKEKAPEDEKKRKLPRRDRASRKGKTRNRRTPGK